MLYDSYEKRVQKIAKVKNTIIKYKVLILGMCSLFVLSILTLFSINGMIVEDLTFVSSIQYGEELNLYAEALFGDVEFEFRNVKSNEWVKDEPILPGNYEVRAVSSRSFGLESTGNAVAFTISAKEVDIEVLEEKIIYGDSHKFYSDLEKGDYIVSGEVVYSNYYSLETNVTPDESSIVVFNEDGVDVSSCYNFVGVTSELTFIPRTITIDVTDKEKTYDGTELSSSEYIVNNILEGHDTLVDISGSILNYGTTKNIINSAVIKYNNNDISHMYNIVYNDGTLKINQKDVTVMTNSLTKTYDGLALSDSSVTTTNLISNDEVYLKSYESITYYGEVSNVVIVSIGVNNNYNITYDYGTLKINKKDINVQTSSLKEIYSGDNFSNIIYSYNFDNLMLDDYFEISDYTKIKFADKVENKIDLIVINDGVNISDSYNIIYTYGTLEIEQRTIVVTSLDQEFIYNDEAFYYINHDVSNLVSKDSTSVISYETITDFGSIENVIKVKVIQNNIDITDSYKIEYNYGTLSVLKRSISVVTSSDQRQYDSTPLTKEGWEYNDTNYELVSNHEFFIENIGSITDIPSGETFGLVYNQYSNYSITKGNNDVTENYEISIDLGKLIINKREIKIKTSSDSKVYDGTELTANEEDAFTIISDQVLVDSHQLFVYISSSIIDVGSVDNKLDSYKVMYNNIDVTSNYLIQEVESDRGTLEVTKRYISVRPKSDTKMYDGTALTNDEWEYVNDIKFVEGHIFKYEILSSSTITDYGSVKNSFNGNSLKVYDQENNDKTSNYMFFTSLGDLVITKRDVFITTYSDSKTYDDTALTAYGVFYNEDNKYELVLDHEFKITYSGTITNYVSGGAENTISKLEVLSGDIDKTTNYNIDITNGILTIIKRDVTVYTSDSSYMYNGLIQFNKEHTVDNIILGHETILYDTPEYTDVISGVKNDYKIYIYKDENDISYNYGIVYDYGDFEIVKREINIETNTSSKIYDGLEYVDNTYIYKGEYELVLDHEFDIVYTGTITDYTDEIVDNTYSSFKVMSNSIDKTSNYDVTITLGELSIIKREVNIETNTSSKIYDGLEYVDNTYIYNEDNEYELVLDHEFDIVYTGTITDYTEDVTKNTFSSFKVMSNNVDKTFNYDVTITLGELSIIKRDVSFVTLDNTKEYDGQELIKHEYGLLSGNLVLDHKLDVIYTGTITDYGFTDNTYSEYKVLSGIEDKTHNYNISISVGELSITKKVIAITLGSLNEVYDGLMHTSETFTYDDENKTLYDDESFEIEYNGYITHYGFVVNGYDSFVIIRDDIDISDNYHVLITEGLLEINQRSLTVELKDLSGTYNGLILENTIDDLNIDNLVDTDTVVITSSSWLQFYGETNNDVTIEVRTNGVNYDDYKITYLNDNCTIKINKKDISISSNDLTKVYDGNIYSDCSINFDYGNLAVGDGFNIKEYNSIIDFGTMENEFIFEILNEDGVVVTDSYNVVTTWGTLTIDIREVIIVNDNISKEYDGISLSNTNFNYSGIGIASTDSYSFTSFTEALYFTNGEIENEVIFTILRDGIDVTKNYDFTGSDYGTLEITKRVIDVLSASNSFVYNGEVQVDSDFTYNKVIVDEYKVDYTSEVTNVFDEDKSNYFEIFILNELAVESYYFDYKYGVITILPKDINVNLSYASKEYDGTVLTSTNFEEVEGLVNEHEIISLDTNGTIINYIENGVENNYIEGSIILNNNEYVSNYNFIVEKNILEIIKRDITIETYEATSVYNKEELYNINYNYDKDRLVFGDEISILEYAKIINVGEIQNIISVEIGNDIYFDNYNISYNNNVYLIVTQADLFVTSSSNEKCYDGVELFDIDLVTTGLIDGDEYDVIKYTSIIDCGTIKNEVTIKNDNYNIDYEYGYLTINKTSIVIESIEKTLYYNGLEQTIVGSDLNQIENHTLILSFDSYITPQTIIYVAGSYVIEIYRDDKLVNDNYEIEYQDLTLIISKAYLKVSTSSIELDYNGENQSYSEPTIYGNLAECDELSINTVNVINLGVYTNTFLENKFNFISQHGKIDDLYNYEFIEEGFITINQIYLSIETATSEREYNAEEFYNDEVSILNDKNLLDGHRFVLYDVSTITDVLYEDGQVSYIENLFGEIKVLDNSDNDVTKYYEIYFDKKGKLTINPATVDIYIYNINKKYDDSFFNEKTDLDYKHYVIESDTFGSTLYADAFTNATAYQYNLINISFNNGDKDTTGNFIPNVTGGNINYSQINITITPDDVYHTYDGSSVYCTSYYVSSGLLSGHDVYAVVEGIRHSVGETITKIDVDRVTIHNEQGYDVKFFYNITVEEGKIVIER